MPPEKLNTVQAADEINRIAAAHGSPRRVQPATVRDWRMDRKGPAYAKVSNYFVEYDPDVLAAWTRQVYLGLPPAEPSSDAEATG